MLMEVSGEGTCLRSLMVFAGVYFFKNNKTKLPIIILRDFS